MHEIAENCAPKSLAAGSLPQTPLGQLTTLPKPLSRLGRGVNFPQRLRRLVSSPSATQVQRAPPKTIFWIVPECRGHLPPKNSGENIFSGSYRVKFGHFLVNTMYNSDILLIFHTYMYIFGQKCLAPKVV